MIRHEPIDNRQTTAPPASVQRKPEPSRAPAEPGAARRAVGARVLVLSIFFAPCRQVGGKRFSNLSRYLSSEVSELHVLAKRERTPKADSSAFRGNVHRTSMFPQFPPARRRGFRYKASRFWAKWVCQIDPYIGWVIPATLKGIALCREHRLNVLIVTVPAYSALIGALLICRVTGCRLVIDYRDEWTNHSDNNRLPFGRSLSRKLERAAIRRASAVVVCTDVMHRDFLEAFSSVAPARVETIYSGYEHWDEVQEIENYFSDGRINMAYAGQFYAGRRLSLIVPALASLRKSGVISPDSFRLHLWSRLDRTDYSLMARYGLSDLIEVHEMVSYDEIRRILRSSDILLLPSGDDHDYAVPFKFFDYLGARRPILAVASKTSAVCELFERIDCGICAEIGNTAMIARSLETLVRSERRFTYAGAERFTWRNSAARYCELLDEVSRRNGSRRLPKNDRA